jgi:WD40 repeat protein
MMKNEVSITKVPVTLEEALKWKCDAFGRRVAIIENFLRGTESYMITGYFLSTAKVAEDWKDDGSDARNFYEWVEKELKIKTSNAKRMIYIWDAFSPMIRNHAELIKSIDFSKLSLIAPLIGAEEENALEWLHAAKELTVKDLENHIKAHKGKPTSDNCDHINTENWLKCVRCGKFIKDG